MRHKVDEKKIKDEFIKTNFTDLVKLLAKKKAESIMEDYPGKYNYWFRSNFSL